MPVRSVHHGHKNIIGHFPSLKLRRMVAFESLLERDYLYLLDFERDVLTFEEQPLTIRYHQGTKNHSYTPDFLLQRPSHPLLVECKPTIFVDTPENQVKFAAARAWCVDQGYTFQIVTDVEVRTAYRLENVKFLTRFARQIVPPQLAAQIYQLLVVARDALTIADLARMLDPHQPQRVLPTIFALAFHHQVVLPLDDIPLSADACIQLPHPALLPGALR